MKILYIDLETTGLDPVHDQVLEIGMVIDDLTSLKPLNELPKFGGIIYRQDQRYSGHPFALAMNHKLLKAIADRDPTANFYTDDDILFHMCEWLDNHWLPPQLKIGDYTKNHSLNIGGKNVAGFDVPFLKTLLGIEQYKPLKIGEYTVKHRVVDPGMLYLRVEDDCVPDLNTCLKRAGITKQTNHTAIDDCLLVAELIRKRYE